MKRSWPSTTRCQTCGRNVVWAVTRAGTWLVVDPEPSPEGTIALEGRLSSYAPRATIILTKPPPSGVELHRHHHATCLG